jgi:ubiquinone/menaquinone biosynthesis C-methylase UbiE
MTPAVTAAHEFLRQRVAVGGCALDATAGQGHDTAFLARLLGEAGAVHACDIQPSALDATRRRWETLAVPKASLHLHLCGHEKVRTVLETAGVTRLNALTFSRST